MGIDVVGSINMDLVAFVDEFPGIGETISGNKFLTVPGGKGANQAVAASRLGASVRFIGCVGEDSFGKELLSNLQNDSIDTTFIRTCPNVSTGTAVILVNAKAQNQIVVIPGANHELGPDDVRRVYSSHTSFPKIVVCQFEIPVEAVIKTIQFFKRHHVLVVLNPAPAADFPERLLESVDYFIPNEHEALRMSGEKTVEKAAKHFIEKGAKCVVITAGAKGSFIYDGKPQWIQAIRVKAVDTTAAGDAFVGAFATALLEGKNVESAVRFGNAAGALAVTKIGAQPSLPTRKELNTFMKGI